MKPREISFIVLGISAVLLIYLIYSSYTAPSVPTKTKRIPIIHLFLGIFIASIGAIALSYYFLSKRIERFEKSFKMISKLKHEDGNIDEQTNKKDISGVVLSFLSPPEKKVIQKLIENKGSCLQAEVTRMPGMTKLKVHRAVQSLLKKQLIEVQRYGKTNKLILKEEIKEVLL